MVTVYVEYIFLDNLIMNFIILHLVSKLFKCSKKNWRVLLSATIGAIYATISIADPILRIFPLKVALPALMTWCAFGWVNGKQFFKRLAGIYGVTLGMGGAMIGLFYFTGWGGFTRGALLFAFPLRMALLGCVVMYSMIIAYRRWSDTRSRHEVDVEVEYNCVKRMRALIDTANTLTEPLSGKPVMLLQKEDARAIFGAELVGAMIEKQVALGYEDRMRIVSYRALGSEGTLVVIKPKRVSIYRQGWMDVDAFVGINEFGFQKNGYTALLPACMAAL